MAPRCLFLFRCAGSKHPYYVGTQYHPEFLSRPLEPSPPFLGLLLASSGQMDAWLEGSGNFAPKHDGLIDGKKLPA